MGAVAGVGAGGCNEQYPGHEGECLSHVFETGLEIRKSFFKA